MILDAEQRAVLANVGFLLCRRGKISLAQRIFTGLADSAPEKDGPVVGLALCDIVDGQAGHAADMLRGRLEKGDSPIAPALMLYLLTALGMAGRLDEAKQLREDMLGKNMADAVERADFLLAELAKIKAK